MVFPVGHVPPTGRKLWGHEWFHVTGSLRIWLSGTRVEEAERGIAEWLVARLGFHKQVESLPMWNFSTKLADFLAGADLTNVLLIEIDDNKVYSGERTSKENMDNLDLAMKTIQGYLDSVYKTDQMDVYAVGRKRGLHLLVEARISRAHASGKAPLEIKVTGIPFEEMKESSPLLVNLNGWRRIRELNNPVDSDEGSQYIERMAAVLDEYLSKVRLTFDVERTEVGEIRKRGLPPASV